MRGALAMPPSKPTITPVRLLPLVFLALTGPLLAGEATYPLWDGQESVADYAKRVNLPPTQTLDLGNNVKLDLVLIPAGKFMMGTPEPTPVDEDGFRRKIITGQALLALSGGVLLVILAVVIIRAVRKKRRPQLSLRLLLLVTAAAGGCVLSGLHWRQSARGLEAARVEYAAALTRYKAAEDNEKPAHSVTLTKPCYMGKFPVTQQAYERVIGFLPPTLGLFCGHYDWPVGAVSWDEAQAFCKKLTEQTKQTVRLPTEAEWEFACRAGTTTTYYSGDTEADLARVAWYSANSKGTLHPVGQKVPNAFGLYDMHGNVWQWCEDWYWRDYYGKSEVENPQGPTQGSYRVLRGGAFDYYPMECRSANRVAVDPRGPYGDFFIGFRVVVEPASRPP